MDVLAIGRYDRPASPAIAEPLAPAPGAAMSPSQIALVRGSFAAVAPVAAQAAAMFYDRVFERDPSVATLFHGDMVRQGERLMAMIASALALLDEPGRLDAVLAPLGHRHAGYGVQPAHYGRVGGALLDTLAAALGPAFTAEHRAAWGAFYAHVSEVMMGAARGVAAVPSRPDGRMLSAAGTDVAGA